MTNPLYNLIHRNSFVQNSPLVKHEWTIEKRMGEVAQRELFAVLEINGEKKSFSFSLFKAEGYPHFLPKLMGVVTQAIRSGWDHKNAQLSLRGLEEFIHLANFKTPLCKNVLMEYLKNGGDPDTVINYEGNRPISLIFASLMYRDLELLECFLEKSGNPNFVVYTSLDGKLLEGNMAYFAVHFKRLDILERVIKQRVISKKIDIQKKVIIDRNHPPSSPLHHAIKEGLLPYAKLILENIDPLNDKELGELLLFASDAGRAEMVKLLLKTRGQEVTLEYAQDFMDHIDLRKMLGHRFGIALERYDTGLGFCVNIPTEGTRPSLPLERELKTSLDEFFIQDPLIKKFLNDYLTNEIPSSEELLKTFQCGLPISIKANWPRHFIRLFLVKKMLFVFNRGVMRERGADPGIQVYLFENPSKLKEEHLTLLQKSPDLLLTEEKREEMGLHRKRFATLRDDPQPGGFCYWNNSKSCLQFLLALSAIPEKTDLTDKDYLELLQQGFDKTVDLYKAWSTYDRELGIKNALTFYREHPEIEPDLPLLLFVLANNKSKKTEIIIKLANFINKQDLKDIHFLTCDKFGKNLLHHVSNGENWDEFEILIEECIDRIFPSLVNSPDRGMITPLEVAIKKGKWEIVAALLGYGAFLSEERRVEIYKAIFEEDSLPSLQKFEDVEDIFAEKTLSGYTALHYAYAYKANLCIEYLEKSERFIKSPLDLIEYRKFAERQYAFSEAK